MTTRPDQPEHHPPAPDGTAQVGDTDPRDVRRVRLEKLARLRAMGVDPYPARVEVDDTIAEVRERFGSLLAGEETETRVRVAGRILLQRDQGRLVFTQIRDHTAEIQLFVSRGVLGEDRHNEFKDLDLGDWVVVGGVVMVTKRGELSVKVHEFSLLAKSLRPLPDKWHGLQDIDTRFRQRYVDLIVNEDARRVFEVRRATIRALRGYLDDRGFAEVETPVLSIVQGGAAARPFSTHLNALDLDTYLRIALELHHKRLIIGGLGRVYEIGRIFRNEGVDSSHNPEFTMLEAYQAFADYRDMMRLTEELVAHAAREALGTTRVVVAGKEVDLAPPWPRESLVALVAEKLGVDVSPAMPLQDARRAAQGLDLEVEETWGAGRIVAEIFDRLVEDDLLGPVFVTDYPAEVSPLARRRSDDPTLVERFEVLVGGSEIANAYTELNDPVDQLRRFEEQARLKAKGDPEAGDIDYDYIRALEYGLPPTGGLGIGVDRLVMLLAGVTSIREVIFFPTLRPEQFDPEDFGIDPSPGS